MSAIVTEVHQELKAYLLLFQQTFDVPVVFPNVEPDDVIKTDHIVLSFEPLAPTPTDVSSSESKFEWLLRLVIKTRDGTGDLPTTKILQRLCGWLPPMKEFTGSCGERIYISRAVNVRPGFSTDGWFNTPAHFRVTTVA